MSCVSRRRHQKDALPGFVRTASGRSVKEKSRPESCGDDFGPDVGRELRERLSLSRTAYNCPDTTLLHGVHADRRAQRRAAIIDDPPAGRTASFNNSATRPLFFSTRPALRTINDRFVGYSAARRRDAQTPRDVHAMASCSDFAHHFIRSVFTSRYRSNPVLLPPGPRTFDIVLNNDKRIITVPKIGEFVLCRKLLPFQEIGRGSVNIVSTGPSRLIALVFSILFFEGFPL